MDQSIDQLKLVGLVTKARQGDQESLSELSKLVEDRVFAYIQRLTLNRELSSDLTQETLMEMVKSIRNLKHPERFLYWLFQIALMKVRRHFQDKQKKGVIPFSVLEEDYTFEPPSPEPFDRLGEMERRELTEAVFGAVRKLKISHRSIVALRCYERMSYSEIAELMDCSEIKARVLFYRAKMALKKQLSLHGFSKAYLLVALALFGLLTTPSKAAAAAGSVTTASLEVGPAAVFVSFLGTKLGIVLTTVIAAVTFSVTIKFLMYILAGFIILLFSLVILAVLSVYE
jgi:RNA polymerase sigma-70 factor (ECF subfamily)